MKHVDGYSGGPMTTQEWIRAYEADPSRFDELDDRYYCAITGGDVGQRLPPRLGDFDHLLQEAFVRYEQKLKPSRANTPLKQFKLTADSSSLLPSQVSEFGTVRTVANLPVATCTGGLTCSVISCTDKSCVWVDVPCKFTCYGRGRDLVLRFSLTKEVRLSRFFTASSTIVREVRIEKPDIEQWSFDIAGHSFSPFILDITGV